MIFYCCNVVIWVGSIVAKCIRVSQLTCFPIFGFGWLSSLFQYVLSGVFSNHVCGAFFWCIIYSPVSYSCLVCNGHIETMWMWLVSFFSILMFKNMMAVMGILLFWHYSLVFVLYVYSKFNVHFLPSLFYWSDWCSAFSRHKYEGRCASLLMTGLWIYCDACRRMWIEWLCVGMPFAPIMVCF